MVRIMPVVGARSNFMKAAQALGSYAEPSDLPLHATSEAVAAMEAPTAHLPGLDGLRMVSVLLVVVYHFGFLSVPGGHGVLAFFVISGFLITWLLLKEEDRYGAVSLKLFYIRRTLRIFPAFYAFWILWTAAMLAFHKPIIWPQALSALAYVNNYYQAILGDPGTGYSHTWSLGIEEQFYLLWPVSFIALRRRRSRAVAGVAGVILAVWIHRAILKLVVGVWQGYFYEAFDTRADHLMMGCLLALLLHDGYLPGLFRRLRRVWVSVVTVALLVVSVALGETYGSGYRDIIGFALDPLLIAAIIVQAMALRESPAWSWLNWRPVRYLGALSYSIYLYQQVIVEPAKKLLASQGVAVQLAGVLVAVVLAAAASYHLVECPFLRLKDRIGRR